MKSFLLTSLLLFLVAISNAQLGKTKFEVINKVGSNYETATHYKYPGITYKRSFPTEGCGNVQHWTTYLFKNSTCCEIIMCTSRCAANEIIDELNNSFIKVGELKWKDYTTDMDIEVIFSEEAMTVFYY